jgi:hypothetical protein
MMVNQLEQFEMIVDVQMEHEQQLVDHVSLPDVYDNEELVL